MSSKIISQIKSKLNFLIKGKEAIDIIIFGSAIKGKAVPGDIDIAIITDRELSKESKEKLEEFHASIITLKDFVINPPTIVSTLLKEGYSIKNNRYLAENFRFTNKALFKYSLVSLSPSDKVKIVNILRGKGKEKGLVEKNGGEWLANQVFFAPVSAASLFEEFFSNFKVVYKKYDALVH